MPFNQGVKKLITRDKKTKKPFPCVMCGSTYPLPEAAHIIDEKEWKKKKGQDSKDNGIPLCSNCHKVFDEILRPYLYKALVKFGVKGMPEGWSKSNKLSVTDANLPTA